MKTGPRPRFCLQGQLQSAQHLGRNVLRPKLGRVEVKFTGLRVWAQIRRIFLQIYTYFYQKMRVYTHNLLNNNNVYLNGMGFASCAFK